VHRTRVTCNKRVTSMAYKSMSIQFQALSNECRCRNNMFRQQATETLPRSICQMSVGKIADTKSYQKADFRQSHHCTAACGCSKVCTKYTHRPKRVTTSISYQDTLRFAPQPMQAITKSWSLPCKRETTLTCAQVVTPSKLLTSKRVMDCPTGAAYAGRNRRSSVHAAASVRQQQSELRTVS